MSINSMTSTAVNLFGHIKAGATASAKLTVDRGIKAKPDDDSLRITASTYQPVTQEPEKNLTPAIQESALSSIVRYIPSEIIALYVALRSLLPSNQEVARSEWYALIIFLVCTPLVTWCVYAAKFKTANGKLPFRYSEMPMWEMFASFLAFASWGIALPQTPFRQYADWYSAGIAGFGMLLISTILGLISPLVKK